MNSRLAGVAVALAVKKIGGVAFAVVGGGIARAVGHAQPHLPRSAGAVIGLAG